jgi:hypothetical protein
LSRILAVRLAQLEARCSGDLVGGRAGILGGGSVTVIRKGHPSSGEVVPLGCRDWKRARAPASCAGGIPEGFARDQLAA